MTGKILLKIILADFIFILGLRQAGANQVGDTIKFLDSVEGSYVPGQANTVERERIVTSAGLEIAVRMNTSQMGGFSSPGLRNYAADEVIFKMAVAAGPYEQRQAELQEVMRLRLEQVAAKYKLRQVRSITQRVEGPLRFIQQAQLAEGVSVEEALEELKSDPMIEWAEPHYYRYTQETAPDDPKYQDQWHFAPIKAEAAWDITTGEPNVVIAVIDTGVDWNHPDLFDNIWINMGEIGRDGIDNDNNGYIDDVWGWDFVSVDADEVYEGEDPGPRDDDPMDFHGHGTHVSGIAAGRGNNQKGIAGVSWHSKIMAVRAGYKDKNGRGILQTVDIAKGLVYAADNGAHIINMSFGSTEASTVERIAIDYAARRGCILVAAAGNDEHSWPTYPACFNGVVSVAATEDASDVKARYSNFSLQVDVVAPGSSIYSTYFDNKYEYQSGTSMASPIVAGVAALVKSAHPKWSGQEIIDQIIATADDIDEVNPYFAGKLGGGRVNAQAAVGDRFSGVRLNLVSYLIQDPNGDNDDEYEPNEVLNLYTTIKNYSGVQAVTAALTSNDPWITILNSTSDHGIIESHRSRTNLEKPYKIFIEPNIPADHKAVLHLEIRANGISAANERIDLTLASSWSRPHVFWHDESNQQVVGLMKDGRLLTVLDMDNNPPLYDGIYATIREPGGTFSPLERLSGTTGWTRPPDMDFDPNGNAHVIYSRNDPFPDEELFYTRYDVMSDSWTDELKLTSGADIVTINSVTGKNTYIAADSSGLRHVVWADQRSKPALYYTYHNGQAWQPETKIYDPNGPTIVPLALLDKKDGTRYLFFDLRPEGGGDKVTYFIKGSGSSWQEPNQLTTFAWQSPPVLIHDEIYLLFQEQCFDDLKLALFSGIDWVFLEKIMDNPFGTMCSCKASMTRADDGSFRLAYDRFDSDETWIRYVDWTVKTQDGWADPVTLNRFNTYLDHPKIEADFNLDDHILAKNWEPSGSGWYGNAKPAYLTTSSITADLLPPRPEVTDDGVTTTNPRRLHTEWSSSHPSGIHTYMYAVGTAPGSADVVDWTRFTGAISYTRSMENFPLLAGQDYYVSIQAHSNAVYTSSLGVSDGIIYLPGDFNHDGIVNLPDFAVFSRYWMETNCYAMSHCGDADFEPDGDVDLEDLAFFLAYWLKHY